MPHLEMSEIIMIVCVALFTTAAAVTDLRTRRIPNKLTLPIFVLGLIYQCVFHGLPGLADAAQAFALGFGTLFVLWLIGGGGGGDAKLMGALSVWLNFRMTLGVLVLSTLFVIIGTFAVIFWGVVTRGARKTKQRYTAPSSVANGRPETVADRQNRRLMTYAFPVALATWVVLAWFHLKH